MQSHIMPCSVLAEIICQKTAVATETTDPDITERTERRQTALFFPYVPPYRPLFVPFSGFVLAADFYRSGCLYYMDLIKPLWAAAPIYNYIYILRFQIN